MAAAGLRAGQAVGHEPWHRYDLTLARHYAPQLAEAIKRAVGDLRPAVRAYVTRARGTHTRLPHRRTPHPDVAKAHGSHGDPAYQGAERQAAREALAALLAGEYGPILDVLTELYGDSYLAGAHAAVEAAISQGASGAVVASGFGALDAQVDWTAWQPGWGEAANELAGAAGGRGLATLLANAGVTVRGIEGSTLDRLAALLAEGVASGASVDTIAETVQALVDSEVRAELIAVTEVNRAMSIATLDTYRANGIDLWDWLITPGACPTCEGRAAENPHPLDDDPPPGHPRCRCVASPVVTVTASASPEAQAAAVEAED